VKQQPYCHAHGHEAFTGEVYVPPSEDELLSHRALWMAMESLDAANEGPKRIETDRVSMTHLDGGYIRRLFSTAERLRRELKKPQ
jgi:hypothetical protein